MGSTLDDQRRPRLGRRLGLRIYKKPATVHAECSPTPFVTFLTFFASHLHGLDLMRSCFFRLCRSLLDFGAAVSPFALCLHPSTLCPFLCYPSFHCSLLNPASSLSLLIPSVLHPLSLRFLPKCSYPSVRFSPRSWAPPASCLDT